MHADCSGDYFWGILEDFILSKYRGKMISACRYRMVIPFDKQINGGPFWGCLSLHFKDGDCAFWILSMHLIDNSWK